MSVKSAVGLAHDKAHYKGNVFPLAEGQIFGPDRFGAHYIAVGGSYDKQTDMSTVYFKPYLGDVVAHP